jgi:hypothetical protein
MLDTNTLNYIYDNGLIDRIKTSVNKGSIQLFATHIQLDEIQKSSDDIKKEAIKKAKEILHIKIVPTSATVVAIEKHSKHGFVGSRVGQTSLLNQDDIGLLEGLKKVNNRNPLKNTADLIILYTAVIEKMDYLVTDNIDDFKKGFEVFKQNKSTKLQLISNIEFEKLVWDQ